MEVWNLNVVGQKYAIPRQDIFGIKCEFALKGFVDPTPRHRATQDVGQVAHDFV